MNVATVEYVVDLLKDDDQVSPQSDDKLIPGHFFNIEHSPYLFPMFSFKKQVNACMLYIPFTMFWHKGRL
jgi:hypothetical protein